MKRSQWPTRTFFWFGFEMSQYVENENHERYVVMLVLQAKASLLIATSSFKFYNKNECILTKMKEGNVQFVCPNLAGYSGALLLISSYSLYELLWHLCLSAHLWWTYLEVWIPQPYLLQFGKEVLALFRLSVVYSWPAGLTDLTGTVYKDSHTEMCTACAVCLCCFCVCAAVLHKLWVLHVVSTTATQERNRAGSPSSIPVRQDCDRWEHVEISPSRTHSSCLA